MDGKIECQIWKTLALLGLGTVEIISMGYHTVLPQGKYVSLIASVSACTIEMDAAIRATSMNLEMQAVDKVLKLTLSSQLFPLKSLLYLLACLMFMKSLILGALRHGIPCSTIQRNGPHFNTGRTRRT